jgi:hypothetical protein
MSIAYAYKMLTSGRRKVKIPVKNGLEALKLKGFT